MAKYETMLVTSSALDEEASAALIGKFKSLIEANGTIDSVDDWGKRRLAYPIEDETEGVYTVIKFTSEPGLQPAGLGSPSVKVSVSQLSSDVAYPLTLSPAVRSVPE